MRAEISRAARERRQGQRGDQENRRRTGGLLVGARRDLPQLFGRGCAWILCAARHPSACFRPAGGLTTNAPSRIRKGKDDGEKGRRAQQAGAHSQSGYAEAPPANSRPRSHGARMAPDAKPTGLFLNFHALIEQSTSIDGRRRESRAGSEGVKETNVEHHLLAQTPVARAFAATALAAVVAAAPAAAQTGRERAAPPPSPSSPSSASKEAIEHFVATAAPTAYFLLPRQAAWPFPNRATAKIQQFAETLAKDQSASRQFPGRLGSM